jgi:hypothetical protein
MPSIRSSGQIVGYPVSIRALTKTYKVSSPVSIRKLLLKMGVGRSPEIGFNLGIHALPPWGDEKHITNFGDGAPNWGTFVQTFGAAEIISELIPIWGNPVHTLAFYELYRYYLKGKDNGGLVTGFCTSLSSLVCDSFWTGTNVRSMPKADKHKWLTAIHGRLGCHDRSPKQEGRYATNSHDPFRREKRFKAGYTGLEGCEGRSINTAQA